MKMVNIAAVILKTIYVLSTSLISYSLMEALINGSSHPGLIINLSLTVRPNRTIPTQFNRSQCSVGQFHPVLSRQHKVPALVWSIVFAIRMYKCTILYVYCVQGCTRSPTTQLVYRVVLGLGSGVGIILHEQYVEHQPGTVVHSAPCLSWFSSHSACLRSLHMYIHTYIRIRIHMPIG